MSGVPYSSSALLPSELTNLQTVGIGTSNPTEKLHIVNGNIKATGGTIEVGKETDGTSHLGRGRIHSQTFGAGSIVSFSHNNTQAGYGLGLVQTEAGETWLNSATGKTLTFRIAGFEKMRVHSDGKVGIGTTSPSEKLDVDGNIRARGNLRLGSSSDPTIDDDNDRFISTAGQLTIKSNDSGLNNDYVNLILESGTASNVGKIIIGGGETSGGKKKIRFYTSSTERMRITQDGLVGIGTTSPSEKLDVDGNIRARGNIRLGTSSDNTVDDDNDRFISTAGHLTIHANDSGLNESYIGLTLQTGTTNQGKIVMGGGTQHHNRRMQFYTSSTERMRIDWNGNVGINKTNPSKPLHVGGDIQSDGTVIGASSSFGSDDRLKHNEEDISDSLSVIRKLKPQKYQKTKELKAADFNGPLEEDDILCVEAGFIAQDIQNIPELAYSVTGGDYTETTEDSEGNVTTSEVASPHYLNYNNILTYNVAATQELDTTVTALLAEIASLKERLSALEN